MSFGQSAKLFVLLALAFVAGSLYNSRGIEKQKTGSEPQILYYHDPMHPSYRSDKPGVAPDCGMDLVPVYAEAPASRKSGADAGKGGPGNVYTVYIDEEKQRLLGIQTAPAQIATGEKVLRTLGRVSVDPASLYVVNAATDGWITKVQRKTEGDRVQKDQILGSYFARELRAAAQGHFTVLDRLQPKEDAVDASRARADRSNLELSFETLHNLGMTDTQIREIERSRVIPDEVELRSPGSGVIIARNASPGQRFSRGEELYRIADLGHVWILADLFQQDSGSIQRGMVARILVGHSANALVARVSDSVPQFDSVSQTLKLRLNAKNPGLILKPNMFVDVEVSVRMRTGLTVPIESVLDSGSKKTVFVGVGDGSFEPRSVETGWRSRERIEIVKGLVAGDKVVVLGQFLIDSETRMKGGIPPETHRKKSVHP